MWKAGPFPILHLVRLILYGKCHDGFYPSWHSCFLGRSSPLGCLKPQLLLRHDQAGSSSAAASVRRVATSVMIPATAAREADSTAVR
ncbi:hypothetical protein SAMN04488056_103120 [Cohaesibacter marisflavi]|uniref:Uncharacterized protein n=1 Tax=Cohaesibacter marisflavi TaxID=655353 RepID=A0A1I5EBP9_9HYPH|nr:hypothetical protein SAMN04488056_103120 [Cohaesibacter marisflavi]